MHSLAPVDPNFLKHYISVMKIVIITLDEDVARWARIRAAARRISLSHLVRELLQEKMAEEETYQASRQQYLSEPPSELKSREDKYPKRQELHER